jgi:hypothetical protein
MRKYLFFILVFFLSCKKEKQEAQTIYPLPYLPVYPGSKWIYLNEVGDTVIQSTAPEYQLHQYNSYSIGGYMTDYVYVPFWNDKPVYGYSTPIDNMSAAFIHNGLTQIGYLSEKKGEQWTTYWSQYGSSFRVVENIDTSLTVNSINYYNVIKVCDYGHYPAGPGPQILASVSYYAKNIGLIKEDYGNKHIDLISYYINH